jgi:NAD(P)H-nitrite reductase large subunit
MNVKYLVVGNSVAGVNCVEAIRENDGKGTIAMVSDEGETNYSRPLIAHYLGGRLKRDQLSFREPGFYEENGVKLLTGRKAMKLDTTGCSVKLDDGTTIEYEKLLIATGGAPIIPKISGFRPGLKGVFAFARLADADAIVEYIEKNKSREAVVVGAGLIGLKATEGLLERGLTVRIVEMAARILPNTFDPAASDLIEKRLKAAGCTIYKDNVVAKLVCLGDRVKTVVLKGGERLPGGLLVLAIGVRPNLELVNGTKIKTDRGISVDRHMLTSVPNVFAAGDCAQGFDFISLADSVIAIWPVAARQGKIAGHNMAGRPETYPGLFAMNAVQILDAPTISFGTTNPPPDAGYTVLSRMDPETGVYRKIVLKDNLVAGVILINAIERAGIYGMLIREKVDVSSFKSELLDDDFGLLTLPRQVLKHVVKGEGIEV